jgi:hypothetical protein
MRWGVRTLINRHRKAGVRNVSHDFYEGGRHEMLNALSRGKVRASVLAWLSAVLGNQSPIRSRYDVNGQASFEGAANATNANR